MGKIYWCHALGNLASGLVSVFIPVFLLKSGYDFQTVIAYLCIQQVFAAVLQPMAGHLFAYIRPHHLLAVGQACSVVLFALLATLDSHHWSLLWIALFWAGNRTIYWSAFHYLFSSARSRRRANHQISRMNALSMIATMAAPAAGGLLATHIGINYVYGLSIGLFILALTPILTDPDGPSKLKISMPWHKIQAMRRDALASGCSGIIIATELGVWPLFIYLIVMSYAGIGLLTSAIALASVVVTLYVGHREGKRTTRRNFERGLTVYSIASVVRALAQTSFHVFGLNLAGGVGRSLYVTPYMNRYYTNSDGEHRLGYITVMETMCSTFAAAFFFVLLLLSLLFAAKTALIAGLAITAFASLGVRQIR